MHTHRVVLGTTCFNPLAHFDARSSLGHDNTIVKSETVYINVSSDSSSINQGKGRREKEQINLALIVVYQ